MQALPHSAPDPSELSRAEAIHAKLLARLTWWQRHKTWVLAPAVLVAGLLGAGVGFVLREGFAMKSNVAPLCAVLGILGMGIALSDHFNPKRLEAARLQLEHLLRHTCT